MPTFKATKRPGKKVKVTKSKRPAPKKKAKASANDYILIDRSHSMSNKWTETLGAVNAYVAKIKEDGADGTITVATFDKNQDVDFDIVRDSVKVKDWKDITNKDAMPRGWTPLFDAIGKVVALAEKAKAKKTVLVVVTDGEENASKEMTKESAKAALERFKSNGWQVIFLGADFDAFGQAAGVGIGRGQTIMASAVNYGDVLKGVATSRTMYASGAMSAMSFDDDDRAKAVKP